jgi:hypothetical protein
MQAIKHCGFAKFLPQQEAPVTRVSRMMCPIRPRLGETEWQLAAGSSPNDARCYHRGAGTAPLSCSVLESQMDYAAVLVSRVVSWAIGGSTSIFTGGTGPRTTLFRNRLPAL